MAFLRGGPMNRGFILLALAGCATSTLLAQNAGSLNTSGPSNEQSSAGMAAGDASRGKTLYQACEACHSIDENDIGPMHRGVVGRRAGSLSGYVYSPALKKSGITWDETQLDRWLSNPSNLVPGTKMFFKIDDPQVRADIIAYLKEQK
jgi:cytochrome c